jgi:hypothetical protein
MESRFKKLTEKLNVVNYDDLKSQDYIDCGFSSDEAEILMNIYYHVCDIWNEQRDDHIEFATRNLELIDDIRIKYFLEYYLTSISKGKEKYEKAQKLIDLVVKNHNKLFDYDQNNLSEINTLNTLLILSTQMNIQILEMMHVVYVYTLRTGELANFTSTIAHALYKANSKEYEEKFKQLHIERMERSLKIKDVHSLDSYIKKIEYENNKFFDCSNYYGPLYELYLELGNRGRGLIELDHLQKAIKGFNRIGNKAMEEMALAALESLISDNEIGWHKFVKKLGDEDIKKINILKEIQQKYFKENSFEDILKNIDKRIVIEIEHNGEIVTPIEVYIPYPDYSSIKDSNQQPSISSIFPSFTIGEGRIMKKTDEPKFRGVYYDFNMRFSILPLISRLEEDIEALVNEVKNLVNGSDWLSEKTKLYFDKVVFYYNADKAFEFMHFSVVLIEMVLRDMYKKVKGTQIQTMKIDVGAQINVNLQDILKDDDIKEYLGENLYKYIEYNLIDEMGLNLRNNVLHGLADEQVFHHNYSRLLMHTFLVIVTFVNTEAEESCGS